MRDCLMPENKRKHHNMHIFIPSCCFPPYICIYVHCVVFTCSCALRKVMPGCKYEKPISWTIRVEVLFGIFLHQFNTNSSVRYLFRRGLNLEKHEHCRPGVRMWSWHHRRGVFTDNAQHSRPLPAAAVRGNVARYLTHAPACQWTFYLLLLIFMPVSSPTK